VTACQLGLAHVTTNRNIKEETKMPESKFCEGSTRVTGDTFPVAGPQTWNDLPEDVTSAESFTTFRRLLKIHLFGKSFPDYLLDVN